MRKRPPHHQVIYYFYTHPGRWGCSDIMEPDEQQAFAGMMSRLVRSYDIRAVKDAIDRFYATEPSTPILRTFMKNWSEYLADSAPMPSSPELQEVLDWLLSYEYTEGLPWDEEQNDELAAFIAEFVDEAVYTYPGLVASVLLSDPVKGSGDWTAYEVPLNLLNAWCLFAHGEVDTLPGVTLREWRGGKKRIMWDRLYNHLNRDIHPLVPKSLYTRDARDRQDDIQAAIALDTARIKETM